MVTRKDIDQLFDRGSFMEIGDGRVSSVVTGYGRIGDRMVYTFLQDSERDGGAFSVAAASKIMNIYKLALKSRMPVIGLLENRRRRTARHRRYPAFHSIGRHRP